MYVSRLPINGLLDKFIDDSKFYPDLLANLWCVPRSTRFTTLITLIGPAVCTYLFTTVNLHLGFYFSRNEPPIFR